MCSEVLTDDFSFGLLDATDLDNDDLLLRCELPSSLSPLAFDPLRSDPAMLTGLVVMRRSRANRSSARRASHGVIWNYNVVFFIGKFSGITLLLIQK